MSTQDTSTEERPVFPEPLAVPDMGRLLTVLRKELRELTANLGLIASMCALPALMALIPVGIAWTYLLDPNSLEMREIARYFHAPLDGAPPGLAMVKLTMKQWLGLYLATPAYLPILVSAQAVAGEKERRTIEPLLASPATALEIVLGKSLAALLPALLITWLFAAVLMVGVDVLVYPRIGALLLPDVTWAFGMGVLAPLLSLLGNGIAVAISARVDDTRFAQNLAAMFVMPFMALGGAQLAGLAQVDLTLYGLGAVALVFIDVAVFALAIRLFDRERILTRWG